MSKKNYKGQRERDDKVTKAGSVRKDRDLTDDIEKGGHYAQFSRADKDFNNLLEVIGTPKL